MLQMISMTVVRFFWFYNQASIGEFIKFYIKAGKEDIRNGLAFGQKLNMNESVRELAEWVAGWKWKFTACSIFKVDRNLILGVTGNHDFEL
ncbi:unnamed protein product [Allacma fusca]|uniref:Uncharacterized protein n=1 Tax=Allacma fusca TaxID=39272 RepID=A0A8J2PMM5_9HEXA|nr:unnamed protein product [Allacma fusca]